MGLLSSLRTYRKDLADDATLKREIAPLKFCWRTTLDGIMKLPADSLQDAVGQSLFTMYDHWLGSPDEAMEFTLAFAKVLSNDDVEGYMTAGRKFMLVEPAAPHPPTMTLGEAWSRVMSIVESIAGNDRQFRANLAIVAHLAMFHIRPSMPFSQTYEFAQFAGGCVVETVRRTLDIEIESFFGPERPL